MGLNAAINANESAVSTSCSWCYDPASLNVEPQFVQQTPALMATVFSHGYVCFS